MHAIMSVPEASAGSVCIGSAATTLKHRHVVLPVQQQFTAVQEYVVPTLSLCKSIAVLELIPATAVTVIKCHVA